MCKGSTPCIPFQCANSTTAVDECLLTVAAPLQLLVMRVEATRSLPVVQTSLDDALRQHQEQQPLQQQVPLPPPCTPAQGASHNGVALPNLHVEAEFRWVLHCCSLRGPDSRDAMVTVKICMHACHRSGSPRLASEVTIVTQCSFDRCTALAIIRRNHFC